MRLPDGERRQVGARDLSTLHRIEQSQRVDRSSREDGDHSLTLGGWQLAIRTDQGGGGPRMLHAPQRRDRLRTDRRVIKHTVQDRRQPVVLPCDQCLQRLKTLATRRLSVRDNPPQHAEHPFIAELHRHEVRVLHNRAGLRGSQLRVHLGPRGWAETLSRERSAVASSSSIHSTRSSEAEPSAATSAASALSSNAARRAMNRDTSGTLLFAVSAMARAGSAATHGSRPYHSTYGTL